ncbi:unnamed protein product [Rhodiola kirilowii]
MMAVALLLCMMAASAPYASAAAITCTDVAKGLNPCYDYVKGPGGSTPPPVPSCTSLRSLVSKATNTADRQAACRCLKTLAGSIRNVNMGTVAKVAAQCGVNIPYKISL